MSNFTAKPLPSFIENKLETYLEKHIYSRSNGKHIVQGLQPSDDSIVLRSNDYLAICNHDYIKARQINALSNATREPIMSAVFQNQTVDESSFEQKFADFLGFDHCIITQSGWAANVGLLQTIADQDTHVYIDFFAHMSLWHGAQNAGSKIHPFLHNKPKNLLKQIKKYGPGIVVIDSVYSTHGTVAPLKEFVDVANDQGCAIIVDESHSIGTHGPDGAGLLSELGLTDKVDFVTTSLAKTFSYRAGAILCHHKVHECLPFISLPAIFSSGIIPYEMEALKATLELIKKSDHRREHLFNKSHKLISGLKSLDIHTDSNSQIVAIETGTEENTEKVRDFFELNGIFGAVFCSPATPKNKSVIRLSVNSEVSDAQLDKVLTVCSLAKEQGLLA
ncbi:quorum-sensing autoinducer CAI-1 synthase [Vibrio penaeicida]|uniref:alpha-hydroxyketone-type quorum-sensing autoinducer synthase n=1 Tax=Vibrio penaeicida TaxID=104609 RepID=UPI002736C7C0|nr:alpha-hydroxyketone-type quorum-sensing autoinducer synthase [Vibrio penaeicida]MDP2572284.1 quorum-sensing autoinducer CAI-1 synthase [Vibrio penaeicida]